jgi:palmitoyltransferase
VTPLKPPPTPHTFVILESRRGDNSFDLGSPLRNLREVMGYTILDWLLPLKHAHAAIMTTMTAIFRWALRYN